MNSSLTTAENAAVKLAIQDRMVLLADIVKKGNSVSKQADDQLSDLTSAAIKLEI